MNSRLGDREECISDLENRIMKITEKEKQIINECNLRDL